MHHVLLLIGLGLLLSARVRAESSHLDRILAAKDLRVCIWPEYYGISYRHPHTQLLSGVDIELARALGKDLGVAPRFVDSSFPKLIDDVTQDRCDIAMFGISITPQRAEKLRFTSPHLTTDMVAITTRSNRRIREWSDVDKPGVVVAVLKGTVHETVLRDKLKAATLLVADSASAREQEVESGRADVLMTGAPYARHMLDNVDWARAVSPPVPYHLSSHAFAMNPGDAPWHARVDQFVAAIKRDGRLQQSAHRHKLDALVAPQ
ncbi:MAG: ABC transporter substrate-binding protein [Pseudomonadota bacterium]